MPAILFLAGPTASGKSRLALRLAHALHGVIINADAMQLYAALPILTAQPTQAEQQHVPHRLYGILPPGNLCSAGMWVEKAREAIDAAHHSGRVPILVGGTSLYLKSLRDGLAPIPTIDGEVREATRKLFQEIGNTDFHALLTARDPETAARLHPSDSQRLMRAYEVVVQTGKSLRWWQSQPAFTPYPAPWFQGFFVHPPRATLYAQCNARFLAMLEQGGLEEVRGLEALPLPAQAPVWKALGVPALRRYLAGTLSYPEAIHQAQAATRHYAKRQCTWFKHQFPGMVEVTITALEAQYEHVREAYSSFSKEISGTPA